MNNFLDETNDLRNKIDNGINDLRNKLNTAIKNLENKQPYIKYENVNFFFKALSPNVDVLQNCENCLKFRYYSHNVKQIEFEHDETDIHKRIDLLCNDIDNYIKNVESTQIIKEITLSFNCEANRNFLDEYLLNSLIDDYINDKLILKYKNFNIKNKTIEKTSNVKLYQLEIEIENNIFYEYFLICNAFCINVSLNRYCNVTMNMIISKMLLSCSFSKEISDDTLYLGISKDELDIAFEIEKNSKQNGIKITEKMISDENNLQLGKLKNLLSNYKNLNNDVNFINEIAFNILLLGNDTKEKNCLLDNIKELFKENILSETKFNLYELDVKKDINSLNDLEKIITTKIKTSNFLVINNFDYIEDLELQAQNVLIDIIINLENFISIIISGDEKRIMNIIEKNNSLLNKFSYIFRCKDYDIDKMYHLLIEKLSASNRKILFDEEEAKTIIRKLSEKSTIKNEKFLNYLYTKMLKYVLENNINEFNISSFPCANEEDIVNNCLNELNNLIGLNDVKKQVNSLISFWKFKNKTSNISSIDGQYFNMFLTGNPGTGKTTVAKILAKILYSFNYIDEDKFIEITPNDLIADYEGQTKTKAREILNQAKGGVLFIDEAYLFLNANNSNGSDFFREALVELLKYMENPNNIVFFAGYSDSMNNVLNLNTGLKSRVATFINFEDYKIEELIQILILKLKKQNFGIENDALDKIKSMFNKIINEKNFGNGRYIDKLITKILMKHAENIDLNISNDLLTISKEDIDEYEILNDKIKNKNNFGFIQENGDV